jgi:hypothetical protein
MRLYCFTEIENLRKRNRKLQEELEELRTRNTEITRENQRSREEISLLLAINKEFGEENDNLRRELPKRQKITKEIEKNRKEMYDESADELSVEPKEKEARVCKLWLTIIFFSMFTLIYSNFSLFINYKNEMKLILKTINSERNLDYEQPFNSTQNIEIRRKLVPELKKTLAPNFKPTVSQITKWLNCLHKSRRSQQKLKKSGRISEDQRRTHNNNRIQEVIRIRNLVYFVL